MSNNQQPTILNVEETIKDIEYLMERMEGFDDWAASGRLEDIKLTLEALVEDISRVEKFTLWLDYAEEPRAQDASDQFWKIVKSSPVYP